MTASCSLPLSASNARRCVSASPACEYGFTYGREQTVMEVRWLARKAPETARQETAVAGKERRRTGSLVYVERLLRIGVDGIGDVVQLEVGVRRNEHDGRARARRHQARRGKARSREVDARRICRGSLQGPCRVVRARLRIEPSVLVERQRWHVARRAPDALEQFLACEHGALDLAVVRNHPPRHLQRRLKERERRDIRPRQLIHDPVIIRVSIDSEALSRLDAVVLIERRGGEFAQGYSGARMLPRSDDEARLLRGGARQQALRRQPFHASCVPRTVGAPRQCAEGDAFRPQRPRLARQSAVAGPPQVVRDLAGDHLDVASAKKWWSRAQIPDRAE